MSDLPGPPPPPGPGWWLASDGRWYPPQQASLPPPPPPPAPPGGRAGGPSPVLLAVVAALVVAGIVAVVLVLSGGDDDDRVDPAGASTTTAEDDGGTGGGSGSDPGEDAGDSLDESQVDPAPIEGGDGEPWNRSAAATITELEEFWAETMPEVFGQEYEPVAGGFWAFSPGEELPPCARNEEELAGNAYYCSAADVVAWDDTGLFPEIHEFSGDLGVALVLAHEWGHVVQDRVGMQGATITFEHQADCYAGAWFAHIREDESDPFTVTDADLDRALANLLDLGDVPGIAASDPLAHGNAFDRIKGFQDGLERGVEYCAGIDDRNIVVTELPFLTQEEIATGGNMAYQDILRQAVEDLEAFWGLALPQVFGERWDPLAGGLVLFEQGETPRCADAAVTGVSYCAETDSVELSVDGRPLELYRTFGDFAVGFLIGASYGEAVQARLGAETGTLEASLQADCYAGVWAASMFPGVVDERRQAGNAVLILSPGDLDEAVAALLVLSSEDPEAGTGFQRVSSFRTGFVDGIEGCA